LREKCRCFLTPASCRDVLALDEAFFCNVWRAFDPKGIKSRIVEL